jgi:hypothetical protein
MQTAPVIPRWLPPPVTIPADVAGPPRFQHDPFARDMALDPGGAMVPRESGTTHVAFGADDGLGLHTSSFRGSIPYPMQSLCTLRTPRCRDARNTRYRAAR